MLEVFGNLWWLWLIIFLVLLVIVRIKARGVVFGALRGMGNPHSSVEAVWDNTTRSMKSAGAWATFMWIFVVLFIGAVAVEAFKLGQ